MMLNNCVLGAVHCPLLFSINTLSLICYVCISSQMSASTFEYHCQWLPCSGQKATVCIERLKSALKLLLQAIFWINSEKIWLFEKDTIIRDDHTISEHVNHYFANI